MHYTKIAKAVPFEGAPKITLARVIGASPKKPILIRIGVLGQRPINISVSGLNEGLTLNGNVITGSVEKEGNYPFTIICKKNQV